MKGANDDQIPFGRLYKLRVEHAIDGDETMRVYRATLKLIISNLQEFSV